MPEILPVSAKAIQPVCREENEYTWELGDLLLGMNWVSTSMPERAMTL